MTRAVFDTNILIDYLNGVQEASDEFDLYEEALISSITQIEILVGAKTREEESSIRSFLGSFTILPVSRDVAEESVSVRRQHGMKVPDTIIYATARTEGTILVTRNSKDFKSGWPDVRVPYQI